MQNNSHHFDFGLLTTTVQLDRASARVIEAHEEMDHGGLATARFADESDLLIINSSFH